MSKDYPRVSSILAGAGLIDTSFFPEGVAARGTAVHRACEYLDQGDLDEASVDPVIVPAVSAYRRFLAEVRPEILAIEEAVVNETYRYRGTLDRRVRINGREGILDLKGICEAPHHGPQLAAYAGCFARPLGRWNLYINGEHYKLIERTDREDWRIFLAALTLTNWKRRHA